MAYDDDILADSPVAYYRLAETSGTVMVDSSGNARDGAYEGSPLLGQPGMANDSDTAVTFNGTSQRGSVPTASWMSFPTGFTISAVVKKAADGWFDVAATDGFEFAATDTGAVYLFANGKNTSGGTGVTVGNVCHIAATWDGAQILTFLNGTQVSAQSTLSGSIDTTTELTIATYPATFSYAFNGEIGKVALFATALSPARIAQQASWVTGVAPPPPPPPVEGYAYTGGGLADYDPPVAAVPAHAHREKVQRVHQSLPAPTLINGRPS